jgi:hypothetical protein
VVAQTYLYTTRPSPGDLREHMHRAALEGLRMVGNKLTAKEEEAHRNKGAHKSRSPRRHNSPWHRSGDRQSRTPSPRRHKSPKHGGTRRSRTPTKAYDYEDDEKERDFYFRALGSLVVLSFPQLLSFSSVLSKPLSETVTSAGTAGCPTVEHL